MAALLNVVMVLVADTNTVVLADTSDSVFTIYNRTKKEQRCVVKYRATSRI